jgi:hypothetical protein
MLGTYSCREAATAAAAAAVEAAAAAVIKQQRLEQGQQHVCWNTRDAGHELLQHSKTHKRCSDETCILWYSQMLCIRWVLFIHTMVGISGCLLQHIFTPFISLLVIGGER